MMNTRNILRLIDEYNKAEPRYLWASYLNPLNQAIYWGLVGVEITETNSSYLFQCPICPDASLPKIGYRTREDACEAWLRISPDCTKDFNGTLRIIGYITPKYNLGIVLYKPSPWVVELTDGQDNEYKYAHENPCLAVIGAIAEYGKVSGV